MAGTVSIGLRYALYSIGPALEAHGDGVVTTARLNVLGSASAHWFINCSKELYAVSREGKDVGLWGIGRYSEARWAAWQSRLSQLAEQEGLWVVTRDLAREAIVAMRRAEKESRET